MKWSKNPEVKARQKAKRRAAHKARLLTDPEYRQRCRESAKRSLRKRLATDEVYRKRFHRQKALSANYGLSLTDYDLLVEAQNGLCGICGLARTEGQPRLAVDHDHESGYIRGLLCMACNTGIGKFKDDVRLLQKAIEWLS